MRFMILIKATPDTEAGTPPSQELLAAMGRFNEELVEAGVMLGGDGLQPTSCGARVHFSGDERTVTDGPFAETKELVCGYWLWQCAALEEAIEWVRRCPNPAGTESDIEIRPLYELEDFGAELTPGLREREQQLRETIASKR